MTSAMDTPFETVGDWAALAEQAAGEQASYEASQAVLKAGYEAITRRVEPVQKALMLNAESQIAELQTARKAMSELAAELRAVAELAAEGELVNLEVYQRADNRAISLIEKARDAPRSVEKLAVDLVEPLAALDAMEKRLPACDSWHLAYMCNTRES